MMKEAGTGGFGPALAGSLLLFGLTSGALARDAAQQPLRGIDQTSFVPLGGLDQWINIRGEDRRNPVLLVVHGGPGEAQWPQAAHYRAWEKRFTVVQWDQRGASHTYGRYGATTPEMTLDRIGNDGVELADYLRHKLGKKKIKTDLPATASRIATAFFVIQGRDDLLTPTADAVAYFDGVSAPFKKLVLIPDAGHFAFMTAPGAFLGALADLVRPVAVARGA